MLQQRSVALALAFIQTCLISGAYAAEPVERRPVAEWLDTALAETKQQKTWESDHPLDATLLLGAGQYLTWLYGRRSDQTYVAGPREFIVWWQDVGASGMERWATDGFPLLLDRDHLIYSAMALASAQSTPRTAATLYINGTVFAEPAVFWAYYDRILSSGTEVYRRALSGEALSRRDYDLLRIYAPMLYSMWGAPYLPFMIGSYGHGMTAGVSDQLPIPGMEAPDFILPRLETILKSPNYTDAYTFDFRRPFHSEVAAFLLHVCHGYEPIPPQLRVDGGPVIKAKPYGSDYPDCVTLSSSRGKKPVLLVFGDGVDGDCASHEPMLEPLYRATKDRIDWYFVCTDLGDNIFWSDYYFPPNLGVQTFQKPLSMEERAQTAKMWSMRWPNLSFPMVLDDLAQHTQIAYTDGGGGATVRLIDINGITSLNTGTLPEPSQYIHQNYASNQFRYAFSVYNHCVISANIKALLDHDAVWNGKDAIIPDWQKSPGLDGATITGIDAGTGTITIRGADGKDLEISVDHSTRIVFAAAPDTTRPFTDLTVGMTISCLYESSSPIAGGTARLIVNGMGLNDFLSYPFGHATVPWCPVTVTAIDGSTITAALIARPRSEMRGLAFWEQAGTMSPSWEAQVVKGWLDHPDQTLTFHLDRATDVIVNGMAGKVSDIRVGDHLGVEIRPEQKPDNLMPFFVFVYRFDARDKKGG